MEDARALFRNPETTEFVIVTIPTVMAVAESGRLAKALRSESVPVKSILINQVLSCFSERPNWPDKLINSIYSSFCALLN